MGIATQALLDALNQLGIKEPGPSKTATLVRDGFCTGRRFLFEDVGVNAIWLMAEQVINLRDDCGELLKTVDLRTTSTGTSRAA